MSGHAFLKLRQYTGRATPNLERLLARIIHEMTSEEQVSPVVVRRAHHPEYIEGRPMDLYLEEVS
jgi:hypothetical protein